MYFMIDQVASLSSDLRENEKKRAKQIVLHMLESVDSEIVEKKIKNLRESSKNSDKLLAKALKECYI